MINLDQKKVLVTGGTGFLGRALRKSLRAAGAVPVAIGSEHVNLLDLYSLMEYLMEVRPDYCIHCAGYNGGIEFNRAYPADILYTNTIMGLNIHHACEYANVKKLLTIMTSCAYPDTGMEVLHEEDFWSGQPNKTIRAHGVAKRILQAASEAYIDQYNFNSVPVCVTNLYGPHDTFNLFRTKVVGALIRKFVEAKQEGEQEVECWGTGSPKREFMYVDDAADAIVQALQKYENQSDLLNIGTGHDITIKELVEYISEAVQYDGEVVWNTEKPDGQMKKLLSVEKMKQIIQIDPLSVKDGIQKTVDWYIENKEEADARK